MKEYSPEDQAAVKGGGMLQQMMSMQDDSSSEEEETEAASEGGAPVQLDEMEKLRKRLKEAGMEDALNEEESGAGSQLQ